MLIDFHLHSAGGLLQTLQGGMTISKKHLMGTNLASYLSVQIKTVMNSRIILKK